MIDLNKVEEEAKKEFLEEKFNSVKDKLVSKLKELDKAKRIVRNIEDEIKEIKSNAGE